MERFERTINVLTAHKEELQGRMIREPHIHGFGYIDERHSKINAELLSEINEIDKAIKVLKES